MNSYESCISFFLLKDFPVFADGNKNIHLFSLFIRKKTPVFKENSAACSIRLCKNTQHAGLDTVQSKKGQTVSLLTFRSTELLQKGTHFIPPNLPTPKQTTFLDELFKFS